MRKNRRCRFSTHARDPHVFLPHPHTPPTPSTPQPTSPCLPPTHPPKFFRPTVFAPPAVVKATGLTKVNRPYLYRKLLRVCCPDQIQQNVVWQPPAYVSVTRKLRDVLIPPPPSLTQRPPELAVFTSDSTFGVCSRERGDFSSFGEPTHP